MKIKSVNKGKTETIAWRGKTVQTGIYKYPVEGPLFLGKEDVEGDSVVDRRYHGGFDKACYLFSAGHYPLWQKLYPGLDWQYGMFGENLTVDGLNEKELFVGDTYKVGGALVQLTQPRQPCFKLGVRMGTQKAVSQFIGFGNSGVYVRILEEGEVAQNDQFVLVDRPKNSLTIWEIFNLLYADSFSETKIKEAAALGLLAESCRKDLLKKL